MQSYLNLILSCLDPEDNPTTFMISPPPPHFRHSQSSNPLSFPPPPGSVICDACSLAAEGETDIQENFCHSSYGENKLIQITWRSNTSILSFEKGAEQQNTLLF